MGAPSCRVGNKIRGLRIVSSLSPPGTGILRRGMTSPAPPVGNGSFSPGNGPPVKVTVCLPPVTSALYFQVTVSPTRTRRFCGKKPSSTVMSRPPSTSTVNVLGAWVAVSAAAVVNAEVTAITTGRTMSKPNSGAVPLRLILCINIMSSF